MAALGSCPSRFLQSSQSPTQMAAPPFIDEDARAWSLPSPSGSKWKTDGRSKVRLCRPPPSPPLKMIMMVTPFNLTLSTDLGWWGFYVQGYLDR